MSKRTREQIGEMVAQMENAVCAYTIKAGVVPSDLDDVRQELRMNLCTAAARFDPARGVKWSSYAIKWIVNHLRNRRATMGREWVECNTDDFEGFAAGRSSRFEDDDNHRHRATEDEEEQDAPFVALSLGLKRAFAEPILAQLTAKQRELIEALVFDGFTVEQVADQWQQPVKVVRCNLKNTLRTMAEAGLVDHVMSDADVGRILNKDQSPIRRGGESSSKQAEAAAQARAAKLAERERKPIMQAAAAHPDAAAVLDAMGADVASAVRAYLAGECSFNDAAVRVALTPHQLGKRCQEFRALAEVGHRDTRPVVDAVELVRNLDASNPPPIAPPAPNRAELALARAAASQRARQDAERRAALERAVRQPAVESEWAALGDDTRVAVLGYLSREWTFEQAADLLGMSTHSLGKRLQRIKRLAAVELRLHPHAVPERNSGAPIASVGHPLTA